MNDELLKELLLLEDELNGRGVQLVLGGGMSFYLRHRYLRPTPSTRYPFQVESRSTNDLDFYLTSDLIVNQNVAEEIKQSLQVLGYIVNPEARNFQFLKEVETDRGLRTIKVDLLSPPPSEENASKVEINGPRIKPKGVSEFHARLTQEAIGIDMGTLSISGDAWKTDVAPSNVQVCLPSAFNYIILKLHAFNDRKNRSDEKSDYGRHHAFDIFATVSSMNEDDWVEAKEHFKNHKGYNYLNKAAQIQKECFTERSGIGLLRLRENEVFRKHKEDYEPFLKQFIDDLKALFSEQ